jgi:hypothetical protein
MNFELTLLGGATSNLEFPNLQHKETAKQNVTTKKKTASYKTTGEASSSMSLPPSCGTSVELLGACEICGPTCLAFGRFLQREQPRLGGQGPPPLKN